MELPAGVIGIAGKEAVQHFPHGLIQRTADEAAVTLHTDQSGIHELLGVMRHRRGTDFEFVDEMRQAAAFHFCPGLRQDFQIDGQAIGVGQRLEGACQAVKVDGALAYHVKSSGSG